MNLNSLASMRISLSLIIALLFSLSTEGQHISQFQSLGRGTQSENLVMPSSHSFQVIIQKGDNLTDGSLMPAFIDYSGFMQKGSNPDSAWLCVNSEDNIGAVVILELYNDPRSGLWDIVSSGRLLNLGPMGGTSKNCSGQVMPWGTFISCEETVAGVDANGDGLPDWGWCMEIDPKTRKVLDYDGDGVGDKLWEMGRMYHENIAIASDLKTVYFGDDREHSGFVYKFICDNPTKLNIGDVYVMQRTNADSATWIKLNNKDKASQQHLAALANLAGATNFEGVEDLEIRSDGRVFFSSKFHGAVYSFLEHGTGVHQLDTFAGTGGKKYILNVGGGNMDTVLFRTGADNMAFDNLDNLWLLQDELHMADSNYTWVFGKNHTKQNPDVRIFKRTAKGAEPSGISFTPNNNFLFMSVMHPDSTNNQSQIDMSKVSHKFDRDACVAIGRKEAFKPRPAIVANPSNNLCINESAHLSVWGKHLFTFQWYRNGVLMLGETDTFIVVNQDADFYCQLNGLAGSAYSDTISIRFHAKPNISLNLSGTGVFCADTFNTINALSNPNYSYTWRRNSADIGGQTSSSLQVITNGNYDAIISNLGCRDTSSIIPITVNPLPTAQFSSSSNSACIGDSILLSNSVHVNGNNYQWLRNGSSITSANSQTYYTKQNGLFSLRIIDINSCKNTSTSKTIIINPLPDPSINRSRDTSICEGLNLNMMALTSGLTYQWLRNNAPISGASQQSYGASSPGNYSLRVHDINNCIDTSEAIILGIDSVPSNTLSASSSLNLCPGDSVILSGTNRNWIDYQWFNGLNPITGETGFSYKTFAAGNFKLELVNQNNFNCKSSSQTLVVTQNTPPTIFLDTIGSTAFCEGDSVILAANSGSNGRWQWYRSGIAISSPADSTLIIFSSGNYSSSFYDNSNCMDSISHTSVIVNTLPNASTSPSGIINVCPGDSSQVIAINNGQKYQWYKDGSRLIGDTSVMLNLKIPGQYHVEVRNMNDCTAASPIVSFYHDSIPAPNISKVNNNLYSSKGRFYQWFRNDSLLVGYNARSITAPISGKYSVEVTDSLTGCKSISEGYDFIYSGLLTFSNGEIKIFPNPSRGSIFLQTRLGYNRATLEMINNLGQVVLKKEFAPSKSGIMAEVNFDHLSNGVYTIKFRLDSKTHIQRLNLVR